MSEPNGSTTVPEESTETPNAETLSKGKGKAADPTPMQDASMDDEGDSSEEETGDEEQARFPLPYVPGRIESNSAIEDVYG